MRRRLPRHVVRFHPCLKRNEVWKICIAFFVSSTFVCFLHSSIPVHSSIPPSPPKIICRSKSASRSKKGGSPAGRWVFRLFSQHYMRWYPYTRQLIPSSLVLRRRLSFDRGSEAITKAGFLQAMRRKWRNQLRFAKSLSAVFLDVFHAAPLQKCIASKVAHLSHQPTSRRDCCFYARGVIVSFAV